MIDLHLMVISYPSRRESLFEAMTLHFAKLVCDHFKLERCQDGDDVLDIASRWKKKLHRIRTLDLFGHGSGGRFSLGDSILFASDGTGYPLAKKLGCRTALVEQGVSARSTRFSGPKLLRDVTRLMGKQRVACGSTG